MSRLAQFLADLKCAAGVLLFACIPAIVLVEVTAVVWFPVLCWWCGWMAGRP